MAVTHRLPPQVLLFLALFGLGLYFMGHISVGLDQELALPKVSWHVAEGGGFGHRGGQSYSRGAGSF